MYALRIVPCLHTRVRLPGRGPPGRAGEAKRRQGAVLPPGVGRAFTVRGGMVGVRLGRLQRPRCREPIEGAAPTASVRASPSVVPRFQRVRRLPPRNPCGLAACPTPLRVWRLPTPGRSCGRRCTIPSRARRLPCCPARQYRARPIPSRARRLPTPANMKMPPCSILSRTRRLLV